MVTIPTFVLDLLFPGVARQTPPETLRIVRHGPAHMLPLPSGAVAFRLDEASGNETSEPVAACRIQLFARTRPSGEHVDWLVKADLVAADGKVVAYDRVALSDGPSGYYDSITGDDRDALLRLALAGGVFVDLDEEEAEMLEREEDQ